VARADVPNGGGSLCVCFFGRKFYIAGHAR
jgi:hypothetical protein